MTPPEIIELGRVDYASTWKAMRQFTDQRDAESTDQLWTLEHFPVFTLGQAGKPEHILAPGDIPIIQSDRGGQVTYHGPGQLIIYLLIDLRRLNLHVRTLVTAIEHSLIATLAELDIDAHARSDAPGVYVSGRKIASLGLRIRRGCSYHGLALNVDMNLEPFNRINPCGYAGMIMTDVRRELGHDAPSLFMTCRQRLLKHLQHHLCYTHTIADSSAP